MQYNPCYVATPVRATTLYVDTLQWHQVSVYITFDLSYVATPIMWPEKERKKGGHIKGVLLDTNLICHECCIVVKSFASPSLHR